jgi:hypothetical protein
MVVKVLLSRQPAKTALYNYDFMLTADARKDNRFCQHFIEKHALLGVFVRCRIIDSDRVIARRSTGKFRGTRFSVRVRLNRTLARTVWNDSRFVKSNEQNER